MLQITNLFTNHYYYLYESFDENVKAKSYTKQISMKRKQSVKCKVFIFYLNFINYYSIIDSS